LERTDFFTGVNAITDVGKIEVNFVPVDDSGSLFVRFGRRRAGDLLHFSYSVGGKSTTHEPLFR
jgi:hypothetical protein